MPGCRAALWSLFDSMKGNAMATVITEDEYLEAVDAMEGFCLVCKDFTRSMVEGDAEKYECPACEKHAVYGTENCLMMGVFEFSEDSRQ